MFKIFSVASLENSHQSFAALRTRLEELGYELYCHHDPMPLIEEVKNNQPDLILLDPAWPGQQGLTTCETLRNDPATENIPIIFIHAQTQANGLLRQCFESGATDFVAIEAGEVEVLARLQAAIRNNQAATQASHLAQQLNTMNAELYERNLQVEKDLYITRQLQQSLLPPILPDPAEPKPPVNGAFSKCHYQDTQLTVSGVYLPCDALGGDIYDVIRFPNGTVGITIADVSGHGVPAGFITAIFKSSIYRTTHRYSQPDQILHHLNNELADIVKTGEYVTSFYCHLHPSDPASHVRQLDYSGAGHPYPLYYQAATQQVIRLQENGTPLVWIKNMEYPKGSISLQPGDKLFLFTDGLSEMRNPQSQFFSEERLEQEFLRLAQEQPDFILDEMMQLLSDFSEGHPLEDDLSMVLIEFSPEQ